jgi:DNA (cytosine-5)-methyltransferase 1
MIVLSLFDGMSCGQIALKECGIMPETYYASEVDKHAIGQTQLNFPGTIQLGDVRNIDVNLLKPIDVLIGGSPCQSFSFAGKRKGMSTECEIEITRLEQYLELKNEGFAFEGQSYLFWEYMRILTDIRKYNPGVIFLLENVEMGTKWERVLSEAIGIFGVHINSALVSAQNRKRIYWTNIRVKKVGLFGEIYSDIPQPIDEGILLRNILQPESDIDEKYYLKSLNYLSIGMNIDAKSKTQRSSTGLSKDKKHNYQVIKLDRIPVLNNHGELVECSRSNCIDANYHKGMDNHSQRTMICVSMVGRKTDENGTRKDNDPNIKAVQRLEPNLNGKTNCLTSVQKDNLVVCLTPKRTDYGKQIRKQYESGEVSAMRKEVSQLEPRSDGKTNTITTVQKDNLIASTNYIQDYSNGHNRYYFEESKSPSIGVGHAMCSPNVINQSRIRRLTPTECARLQTIPDWYIWDCSDTQKYRMLGNGWTIKMIKHIFSFIKIQS